MAKFSSERSKDGQFPPKSWYDPSCRICNRLAQFLDVTRAEFPDYFCAPVPSFGDSKARLLIVGLAPGKHGANASGRPFTGDHAGRLLYETLHRYGLSSAPVSVSRRDRLRLFDCRITNAVKCLPPGNKPVAAEVNNCVQFLVPELFSVPSGGVVLALGKLAHEAIVRAFGLTPSRIRFAHGARHKLPGNRILLSSYHCSRYNTQTRRLTEPMFQSVVRRAKTLSRAAAQ
jgi:uracil-DNA glycosylase family 4